MLKLALRNILRQKARSAMTLAAILFGVIGLILSGGFIQDLFVQLGEATIHSQLGHAQIFRKGYFEAGSRSPEKYWISDPGHVKGLVAKLPEVEDVMARLAFSGLLNNGRTDWPIIGEGVEPSAENRLGTFVQIKSGRLLDERDKDAVLIGQGVAQSLDLNPGDSVTLLVNTPEGALNTADLVVVGVFHSFSSEYDARAIRIPLATAQALFGTRGANAIVVSLKRTADTSLVAGLLSGRFVPQGLDVRTWTQLSDFYEKTVELYQRQFGVLQFIVLFMVLLSVVNTVNMSTFERIGEFGTMRAVGNTGRDIMRLILLENALLGLVGSLVGVLLGYGLARLISHYGIPMPPPPNANVGYIAHIQVIPGVML
ncbi:MAG TPA: ABC transporter permease, partial [Rhodocyclaceae bacterium]|nr:ABC transporter permease [Rhodocyclaceae bacterium]